MPSANNVSVLPTVSPGSVFSYIAPDNGYISIEDYASGYHRISINSAKLISKNTTDAEWGSGWFAVRKGSGINIVFASDNPSIIFATTIGGGSLARFFKRLGVAYVN